MLLQSTTERVSGVRSRFKAHVIVMMLLSCLVGASQGDEPKIPPKEKSNVKEVDETRGLLLSADEVHSLDLPEQQGEQTLTVEFASRKGTVCVYVFKEADAKGEAGLLNSDPKKALAEVRAKAGVLKADVPANTATRVVFREATEKTTVAVKLTNQLAPNAKDVQIKKLQAENQALKEELAELKRKLEKK